MVPSHVIDGIVARVIGKYVFEMNCPPVDDGKWLYIIVLPSGEVIASESQDVRRSGRIDSRPLLAWSIDPSQRRFPEIYSTDISYYTRRQIRRRVEEWASENLRPQSSEVTRWPKT